MFLMGLLVVEQVPCDYPPQHRKKRANSVDSAFGQVSYGKIEGKIFRGNLQERFLEFILLKK